MKHSFVYHNQLISFDLKNFVRYEVNTFFSSQDLSERGGFRSPGLESRRNLENVSMSQPALPETKVGSAKTTQDTKKSASPIGADRYEEIITTSRSRREGSQVMNKMIVIINNQNPQSMDSVSRF